MINRRAFLGALAALRLVRAAPVQTAPVQEPAGYSLGRFPVPDVYGTGFSSWSESPCVFTSSGRPPVFEFSGRVDIPEGWTPGPGRRVVARGGFGRRGAARSVSAVRARGVSDSLDVFRPELGRLLP